MNSTLCFLSVILLARYAISATIEYPDNDIDSDEDYVEQEEVPLDPAFANLADQTDAQRANAFVDSLLSKVKDGMGRQGIPLPGQRAGFSQDFWGFKVHGEADLYGGRLTGFSSLKRIGDATLIENHGSTGFRSTFEVDDLEIQYAVKLTLMGRGTRVRMTGKLDSAKIELQVQMSENGRIQMEEFDILETGGFSTQLSGLGDFGSFFSDVTGFIGNLSKDIILSALQHQFKDMINNALSNLNSTA